MSSKLKKREIFILIFFLVIFSIFILRLYNLTVIKGNYYNKISLNNRITKIETFATRGEIRDTNGKLLAGNEIGFNVKFLEKGIQNLDVSDVAIKIFTILDSYNETHIEFPIRVGGNKYEYIYDVERNKWLIANGFEITDSAIKVFNSMRKDYLISDELTNSEAQNLLYLQGIYLPINTLKMDFSYNLKKEKFLDDFKIEHNINAEEAFDIIKNKSYYHIDKKYSDEDVYKILTLKYAISSKGYQKYDPVIIAENITDKTASKITELNMDLLGISVEIKPIRYYPYGDIGSHILGYMGHIAMQSEIDKYIKEKNYNENQLIGKTGIEGTYELKLTGENGYKYIEVNALGHYIKDVEDQYDELKNKNTISGDNLQLTIDIELQKKLENYLRRAFDGISNGTEFVSKWGNYSYKDKFDGALLGAGVVVDVKNGNVLALASVPTFDLNLFATGISSEDWEGLNPVNKNNPLAPRPLYNNATMTAVQPGSVYKMITGYAALMKGLDPSKKLYSDGFIEIGNNSYGCWLWNSYHGKHGLTDLYKALEVSCNYYFFNIGNGYDYYRDKNLNYSMDSKELIEISKEFGLNTGSGIEIPEVIAGVPNPDKKKNLIKYYLRKKLNLVLSKYFNESITSDPDKTNEIIDEIISWSDENPSRGTIIKRLDDLGAEGDFYKISPLADIIKYDYFNLMQWYEGDTLNLSIGQGSHQYTPIQIAKYITAIANGGELLDLTLIKDSDKNIVNKLNSDYIKELQKGMYQVANYKGGSAYSTFKDFPIKVAGKTGTAEKEGNIPPLDEVRYLIDNLSKIDELLTIEDVETETVNILRERNEKLADLEKEKNSLKDDYELNRDKIDEITLEIRRLIQTGYLNKGYAMRKAIKNLSDKELTDELINKYRKNYSDYAWFVSYAPFDDPEIAVVILIPQGGHGSYASPVAREIIGDYFNIEPKIEN
ncbi:MAG: penicillin-binding transpeptidase domain-containing protein [Bacillota bacterium]|nr:penicillin-binding transpeptidase domain-containing protein [Bacillota bacterium]